MIQMRSGTPAACVPDDGSTRVTAAVAASGLAATATLIWTLPVAPWSDWPTAVDRTANAISRPGTGSGAPAVPGTGGGHLAAGVAAGRHLPARPVTSGPGGPASAGPDGAATGTDAHGYTYSGLVRREKGTAAIDVTPASAGPNTIAVTVLDAGGGPADVLDWSATATLPGSRDVVPVTLRSFGRGVAWAYPTLPRDGRWRLTVKVRTQDTQRATFSHDLPIAARPGS